MLGSPRHDEARVPTMAETAADSGSAAVVLSAAPEDDADASA
jgi:hypothetical protein